MSAPPSPTRAALRAGDAPPSSQLEHDAALVAAYELLEAAQSSGAVHTLESQLARACAHAWHDVEFMVLFGRLMVCEIEGGDRRPVLDRMWEAANATDDRALAATVHALHGQPRQHDGIGDDERDHHLARAVAMLDAGVGRPLTRPVAYIACGLGYRRLGLWQLEVDMYEQAERDLAQPIRPSLRRIAQLNRTVVAVNLREARAALACEYVENGQRDRARAELTRLPPPSPDLGLPQMWTVECAVLDHLVAAILGESGESGETPALPERLEASWTWLCGALALADAVRALDAEQADVAIRLAEQATEVLHVELLYPLRSLAASIAAQVEPVQPGARRYLARLLDGRRQARRRELNSALARLRAEQLALENERLTTAAHLDGLTGLGNRYTLDRHRERLRHLRGIDSIAVLLLDLDGFKPVNDIHGHATGDAVLRRIGEILRQVCGPGDLAARLGGDEFALVLTTCDLDQARSRAALIAHLVETTDWQDLTPDLAVGVSIGTAAGMPCEIDALLDRADQDMYARKHRRRRGR
ncbi:MAG: GGDEF domain-containing protein [Kineosporiaceae bacterium]